jgi:hypothetical protein
VDAAGVIELQPSANKASNPREKMGFIDIDRIGIVNVMVKSGGVMPVAPCW